MHEAGRQHVEKDRQHLVAVRIAGLALQRLDRAFVAFDQRDLRFRHALAEQRGETLYIAGGGGLDDQFAHAAHRLRRLLDIANHLDGRLRCFVGLLVGDGWLVGRLRHRAVPADQRVGHRQFERRDLRLFLLFFLGRGLLVFRRLLRFLARRLLQLAEREGGT